LGHSCAACQNVAEAWFQERGGGDGHLNAALKVVCLYWLIELGLRLFFREGEIGHVPYRLLLALCPVLLRSKQDSRHKNR